MTVDPTAADDAVRVVRARGVLLDLAQRTAFDRAVGVLRCWWHCTADQARAELRSRYGRRSGTVGASPDTGLDAEVSRVTAATDAAADRSVDPDFESDRGAGDGL